MDYISIIFLLFIPALSDSKPESFQIFGPISLIERRSGEISKRKCLEYYPKGKYPILGIAGGTDSLPKEFPHMAALGYGNDGDVQWQCGGSLISKKFVLTAAHCLTSREGHPKYVRLGDLNLSSEKDEAQPQNFTVLRVIIHPSYKPPVVYHDIALLELDREVTFTDFVSPACLNTDVDLNGTTLTATGWGKTGFVEDASSVLLKVNLDHVPHNECVTAFGKYSKTKLPEGIMEDIQLCAGTKKHQDTCQGDSGGPLQLKNEKRTALVNVHDVIGITSIGKACALSAAPGIYTRVSNYISWLESIVWNDEK